MITFLTFKLFYDIFILYSIRINFISIILKKITCIKFKYPFVALVNLGDEVGEGLSYCFEPGEREFSVFEI